MAMKIRLARAGTKKRPFYRIVAADSRMPRDGRFIEKLGTYNPLLPKDSAERVKMSLERIRYWMDQGAMPTDRVSRFLEAAGALDRKERSNPKKAMPRKKAQERAEARLQTKRRTPLRRRMPNTKTRMPKTPRWTRRRRPMPKRPPPRTLKKVRKRGQKKRKTPQ